jgi:hypothetical protein
VTLDPNRVRQLVQTEFGKLPHPQVPSLTNAEYHLYERVAAMKKSPHSIVPTDVEGAYEELNSAGLSPAQFEHLWPIARPLANRLLGRDPNLQEMAHLADAHPNDIHNYFSSLPSPSHPEIQAGALARYLHVAAEPAGRILNRRPLLQEAATFAAMGAAPEDVEQHYQRRSEARKGQ